MSTNIASHHQLLNLAKQGDADSLTTLINQNLLPLGVTVITAIQNECLVVKALLPQHIDRLFLINFMREGMERLQANSIQQVVLIGQDRERISPDWQYILKLHNIDLPPVAPAPPRYIPPSQPDPVTAVRPTPVRRSVPKHPLTNGYIRLLLLMATIGLLVSGTFAAKTVFVMDNHSEPAPVIESLP